MTIAAALALFTKKVSLATEQPEAALVVQVLQFKTQPVQEPLPVAV
jgi:hypothetical protein